MSVYVVFPSANEFRCSTAAAEWKAMGYQVGVLAEGAFRFPQGLAFSISLPDYRGYWQSANLLVATAYANGAQLVVVGADDLYPDKTKPADEIADEFFGRFPSGMGVMQPTGDDLDGTDRICGSPWIGKAYARERGPYHWGYFHFYGDEEMLEVARSKGILWQRPDLTQRHDHWSRHSKACKTDYQNRNDQHWAADKRLFMAREAAGFPVMADPEWEQLHEAREAAGY